jgi:hypothetical protein
MLGLSMTKTKILRARIAKAFATMESSSVAEDIAFHLTDWDHNVDDLLRLYEQPDAFSDDEIIQILMSFLAHVPNHVAAAKKLAGLGPIEDVFQVGVLQEDE